MQTEYKRAVQRLPAVLGKAVILLVIVGMIVFCAEKLQSASGREAPVQIGYAAADSALIRLAVSYVENMEAVKGLCRFVPVAESEGKALLREGELEALLVLPENVIEGILSGSNEPACLYLAENPSPKGLVFEELAGAATGLLQTAQAEIYALHDLTEYFYAKPYGLAQAYQDIDAFNLGIVMEREQYFKLRQLSKTGNAGVAVYYAGAFFTLYLFLTGMFLGSFLKRGREEMHLLKKRGGISYSLQLSGRVFVAGGCLLLLLFPAGLLWALGSIREALQISWSAENLFLVILSAFCAAAWLQFFYLLAKSGRSAVLPAGFATVFMCYVSGCFVPSALLPEVVNRFAVFLPATYVKEAFTALFSGRRDSFFKTCAFLGMFCMLFLAGSLPAARYKGHGKPEKEGKIPAGTKGLSGCGGIKRLPEEKADARIQGGGTEKRGALFWILGKRLLCKKTIWICLLCMVLLSALQYHLERGSDAVITAAVYTPDTKLRKLVSAYDGLVQFLVCEDAEEVKRNVVRGNAECGYVLQEDLQEQIMAGNGVWSIEVYEKADSTMTRVVNEVLFERIFYAISADWFEGYVAGNEMFAEALQEAGEAALRAEAGKQLARRLSDDSTFRFEQFTVSDREYLQEGAGAGSGQKEARTAYPAGAAACAGIVLCGIAGVLEALQDVKKKRFRGRTAFFAGLYTVLQPVLCGVGAAICIICVAGSGADFVRQAAALLLVAAATVLVGTGSVCLMKTIR